MIDETYDPNAPIQEIDESALYSPADSERLREGVLEGVRSAYEKRFPMEDDNVRLEVSNVAYAKKRIPSGPKKFKEALLRGRSLHVPLYGDFRLVDKASGAVLDERKKHLIANVPYLTDRGTFVVDGTEYITFNQSLLRPGIYSRRKENGEIEAHVNVKAGTGPMMRMYLEPETGVFRVSIGASKIKLYPILKKLGVPDESLKEAWGEDLWTKNVKASNPRAFDSFYSKLVGERGERLLQRIREAGEKYRDSQKAAAALDDVDYDKDPDADSLLPLFDELYRENPDDWGTPLHDREYEALWRIDRGGEPAGFVGIERNRWDGDATASYTIGLAKKHRRRGIGRAAVKAILEDAGLSPDEIVVNIREGNHPSIALADSLGLEKKLWPIPSEDRVAKSAADLLGAKQAAAEEPWVGFDLDGTLAKSVPGDFNKGTIGQPKPEIMRILRGYLARGTRVKIFTARAHDPDAIPPIKAWVKAQGLPDLEITNEKTPGMVKLYDDRAVEVDPEGGLRKTAASLIVVPGAPLEDRVDRGALLKAESEAKPHEATDAQLRAGNYRKGHMRMHGFDISIENPKGSTRSGVDGNGNRWSIRMKHTYGYIKGTVGRDKDHVDVFIGPNLDSETVYVVDQFVDGEFDEHKVVFGARTLREARDIYLSNYAKGWDGLKWITPTTIPQFKWWLKNGSQGKPFRGQRMKVASADESGAAVVLGGKASFGPGVSEPGKDALSEEDKVDLVRYQLNRMELDPEVMYRNLGKPYKNFDENAMIDTSVKLLKISRGEADFDDRDAMYNKTFRSPEGMFRDRIDKDHGRLASTLFYRSRYNRGLDALRPGYFTPQLKTLIVGNSLSQAVPGVNLVEFYDLRKKVVQIGEGGISSADMVPMSARNVHPTQLGVVDFLKAPESRSVGIDQRFAAYAKLGPEGQVYTKVIDAKTGKPVWRTPSQLYGKVIQFPDSSDLPFLEA